MFCFALTDWITIRAKAASTVTQTDSQWLDLRGFEDIVVWLQCFEVTKGGATNVVLAYQTAPTKDELLFTAAASVNLAAATAPVVTKVLMSSASLPLARWLRWQLSAAGSTTAFDATFRIWVAANLGPHPLRARTPSPPLRPGGKSCNGDCQKGGSKPKAGSLSTSRDTPPSGNTSYGRTVQYNRTAQYGRAVPPLNVSPMGSPTMTTAGPPTAPGPGARGPDHLTQIGTNSTIQSIQRVTGIIPQ